MNANFFMKKLIKHTNYELLMQNMALFDFVSKIIWACPFASKGFGSRYPLIQLHYIPLFRFYRSCAPPRNQFHKAPKILLHQEFLGLQSNDIFKKISLLLIQFYA